MLKTRISRTRQDVFRIEKFDCYLVGKDEYSAMISIAQNSNTFEATRQHKDPLEAIWRAFCSALSCSFGLLEGAELFKAEIYKNRDSTNTVKVLFVGNGIERQGQGRDSNSYRALAEALVSGINVLP